jgi:hypothetical protein
VNIWVKKDWSPIPNPIPNITIQLYKEVDGVETLVATKDRPDMGGQGGLQLLVYDAQGHASFGSTVPGRSLYQFTDLPSHDGNGKEITYKVKEVVPSGYMLTYPEEVDRYALDNEGKIIVTPELERVEFYNAYYYIVRLLNIKASEKTQLSVTKVWDDENDKNHNRPETIALALYGTVGEETSSVGDVVKISAEDKWEYTFTDLPVKNADGETITYSVKEVLPGQSHYAYTATYTYSADGKSVTITNVNTPPNPELPTNFPEDLKKINIWVKKDWGSITPQPKLTIEVYEVVDGIENPVPVKSSSTPYITNVQLLVDYGPAPTYTAQWGTAVEGRNLYQFKDLPTSRDGKAIIYRVKEVIMGNAGDYEMILPEEVDQESLQSDGKVEIRLDRRRCEYVNEFYFVVRFLNRHK